MRRKKVWQPYVPVVGNPGIDRLNIRRCSHDIHLQSIMGRVEDRLSLPSLIKPCVLREGGCRR